MMDKNDKRKLGDEELEQVAGGGLTYEYIVSCVRYRDQHPISGCGYIEARYLTSGQANSLSGSFCPKCGTGRLKIEAL